MTDTTIMPVARDTKKINQAQKRLQALGLNNPNQLLERARKGADSTVFYDLALVGNLTENLLASIINISARTILNYAQQGKKLEPAQSEHLLKLVLLFELGITAFGTADEFNIWLILQYQCNFSKNSLGSITQIKASSLEQYFIIRNLLKNTHK